MLLRLTVLAALLASQPAFAYIGPGLGAGTVGVILGVLGSIVLALFAIFWYPIKRMLNKGKKTEKTEKTEVEQEDAAESRVKEGNTAADSQE